MRRTFISAAAVLAFTAAGHADELSDIQAQAKQLREQNQTMTKRLADLEKRQKALEAQPAVSLANPVDSMAADLPYKAAVKAKAPESDDMCWHGICLYGNMDMGLNYQNHGAPLSPMAVGPLDYLVSKNSNGSYFGAGPNQLSTSFIGLRGKQEIADNLYAVFNLQTQFDPASGTVANGVGSVYQNNGLALTQTNAFSDSSKAGQMFNGAAYFGISSPTYGTLTMGRQSALTSDLVTNYDPLGGPNAWSVLTYQGANGGGGDTEDRVYDNSFEYRVNVGPVRFAVETQLRNGGNSGTGNAFEGDVGFDYMGLSMDFTGGKIYDAVSSGPLSAAQIGAVTAANIGCSLGCVAGVISDNTVFQVAAKYVIGPWKFYGGYEHIQYTNPDNPLAGVPNGTMAFMMGGYNIAFANNSFFGSDKVLQSFWAGVKYAVTPTLDVMGSYYGYRQNSFMSPAGNPTGTCTTSISPACSGSMDAVSLAMDWRFARHFDFYAGVMYSQKQGGLANGYNLTATNLNNGATYNTFNRVSNYDPGVGLRYQF
ncbi:outer membrane porin protein precursor [mine drainage metagenome]|uniref:Outer membrane porin protein n=1 Tax=mine drainage metagenome TaxID=410659 RepID=A0A1J5PWE7_9ZZZZ